jgi:hypothetical protein
VKRTYTAKLSNMRGVRKRKTGQLSGLFVSNLVHPSGIYFAAFAFNPLNASVNRDL